jgi:lysozyme family protein
MSYNVAIENTLKHEGLYSNDIDDFGAETYMGISRRYHPNWGGWSIVDSYKDSDSFYTLIRADERLKEMVKEYYKLQFWDKNVEILSLDDTTLKSYIFDMSVNTGSWAKIVQSAINKRLKQRDLKKIVVDGDIGENTLKALKIVANDELLIALVEYRIKHYVRLAIKRPTQIKYLMGWINRAFCL